MNTNTNKVALVIGGNSGIGLACAKALKLIFCDNFEDEEQ